MPHATVKTIFEQLGVPGACFCETGLLTYSPHDGKLLATLTVDTPASLGKKCAKAAEAQKLWCKKSRAVHSALIETLSMAIKQHREVLATLVHLDGGKTMKEALAEVDSSADVLIKTVKDATLPELGGMLRVKERSPVGVVGLITSFNFPISVANWTLAPALLAGNAVIWKPSEKTPLVALAYKAIFDTVAKEHKELLQVAVGGRDLGEALVADEQVDMVSATGSVGMGKGIKATLAKKKNKGTPPILELGGNNGVIISDKMTDAHLEWSLNAIMNSFLATTGQRCTNTRRLIVHQNMMHKTVANMERLIVDFLKSAKRDAGFDPDNAYGYATLIDAEALSRFEKAKAAAQKEGGKIIFGGRLFEFSGGAHVEPALAVMPAQGAVMHEETFAPLLFIAPYKKNIEEALAILSAPANAGLVGAIYTLSQSEADYFAAHCEAGHALINSPKGTGTPAYGMGFGGNKDSGCGEILNSADPLAAFTRRDHFTRIAQNKDIRMED